VLRQGLCSPALKETKKRMDMATATLQNIQPGHRERLLRALAAAAFLIFFQAYMVAPLLPRLAAVFGVSDQDVGLIVPAYLIPYASRRSSMVCSQTVLAGGASCPLPF